MENERVAVQACQARLESAAREIAAANDAASKACADAKKSSEEAAELRGNLAAVSESGEKKQEGRSRVSTRSRRMARRSA